MTKFLINSSWFNKLFSFGTFLLISIVNFSFGRVSEISSMQKWNGNFNVICADGTRNQVSTNDILNENVCNTTGGEVKPGVYISSALNCPQRIAPKYINGVLTVVDVL